MQNALFIFSGEFSYELLSFQAILRKYRNQFDKLYVTSFPGRDLLYHDFATEYIPILPEIAKQINPAENKASGFPLYDQVEQFSLQFVEQPCRVISSHSHNWIYPIDEKLDYYGTEGVYINYEANDLNPIIDRMIPKPFVTLHPRVLPWHLHRNYSIQYWKDLAVKIRSKGYAVVFVKFTNDSFIGQDKDDIYEVTFPSIAFQVALLNKVVTAVYCHSGAMFLSLFTQNKFCVLANDTDHEHVHRPDGIFINRKGEDYFCIHKDELNDITPEEVFIQLTDKNWL